MVLAPGSQATAQFSVLGTTDGSPGYAPADPQLPVPLGSTRPEDGGLFVDAQGVLYAQTNPLKNQPLAFRGFIITDPNGFGIGNVGRFIGSGQKALDVGYLTGTESWQPGTQVGIGWKFKDGSTLSLNWLYLTTAEYRSGATLAPFNLQVGQFQENSFLFSPVFNFPPEFAGPPFKVGSVDQRLFTAPFAAFGIWNGASIMTLQFEQKFQQWDLTYRMPVYDTETYRLNAVAGPRLVWIWERFGWRTTSIGSDRLGNIIEGPEDVALYTNITSNRMYGIFAGCQHECYLGHGFALQFDTQAAVYLDSVKERAKYERGDKFSGPESKKSRREWTVVPELRGGLGVMWYPTEFIQVYMGYDVMGFFNTLSSQNPVDFNYTQVSPRWEHTFRLFDGWRGGVGLTF
jgi:hypothetical protein